jgi:hypothetical protein
MIYYVRFSFFDKTYFGAYQNDLIVFRIFFPNKKKSLFFNLETISTKKTWRLPNSLAIFGQYNTFEIVA